MRMVGRFVTVGVALALTCAGTTLAQAQVKPKKVVCTVTAGAISGKRFATTKCYDVRRPGDYVIRSTRWERDDKKAYARLARLSGRRFTCDVGPTKSKSISGDTITSHFGLKNCR